MSSSPDRVKFDDGEIFRVQTNLSILLIIRRLRESLKEQGGSRLQEGEIPKLESLRRESTATSTIE